MFEKEIFNWFWNNPVNWGNGWRKEMLIEYKGKIFYKPENSQQFRVVKRDA